MRHQRLQKKEYRVGGASRILLLTQQPLVLCNFNQFPCSLEANNEVRGMLGEDMASLLDPHCPHKMLYTFYIIDWLGRPARLRRQSSLVSDSLRQADSPFLGHEVQTGRGPQTTGLEGRGRVVRVEAGLPRRPAQVPRPVQGRHNRVRGRVPSPTRWFPSSR